MRPYAERVERQLEGGDRGSNTACPYYPCHFKGQNCTHCFCPFYPCGDTRLGRLVPSRDGTPVWSCKDCFWIHRHDVAKTVCRLLAGMDMHHATDEELTACKGEAECRHAVRARALMVLGTMSGAGKSLMAAALCRIFSDEGYLVSPFKAQNMSLNACVTPDGEEIARIQELQARAARREPDGSMNPILLKPKRDDVSQVVLYGRPYRDMDVPTYYGDFVPSTGRAIVSAAVFSLMRRNDIVIMEGAGSPAEINLGEGDIANMVPAEDAGAPCVLVATMERGGAFAYVLGTLELLPPHRRSMVRGIILNNMHGDASVLGSGIEELEERTGVPVLGVVPHLELSLPSEDSQSLRGTPGAGTCTVGVIRLPRIANFTDFDAFSLEEGVCVRYLDTPEGVADADIIIIPGTKHTLGDLAWLRERGLDAAIMARKGHVPIVGICGGYQMLGTLIRDTACVESDEPCICEGLGLIPVETTFDAYEKETRQVEGTLAVGEGGRVRGYMIHMGQTDRSRLPPLCFLHEGDTQVPEGVANEATGVYGTYLHGIFDVPPFRRYLLSRASRGAHRPQGDAVASVDERTDAELDRLAAAVREAVDMEALCAIMGVAYPHG